jgi:hypothetical protein
MLLKEADKIEGKNQIAVTSSISKVSLLFNDRQFRRGWPKRFEKRIYKKIAASI